MIEDQLQADLSLDSEGMAALRKSPVWDSCLALADLLDQVVKNKDQKSIEFLRGRLFRLVFKFSPAQPDPSRVAINSSAVSEVERIIAEAKSKGWTDEELRGSAVAYMHLSLAQLFITGSKIVSIGEQSITFQTPSGFTQHVWRPSTYRSQPSQQPDAAPPGNPAV